MSNTPHPRLSGPSSGAGPTFRPVGRKPWGKGLSVAVLGCLLPICAAAAPVQPYSVVGEKVFTVAEDDPAVVRRQPVTVHGSAFDRWFEGAVKSGGGPGVSLGIVSLPLFDGVLELEVDSVRRTLGGRSLVADGGRAVLVWGGGALVGTVRNGDDTYRLRTTFEGTVLEAVDVSAYPAGPDDAVPVPPPVDGAPARPSVPPSKDPGTEIDLLVLYTETTRVQNGGTEGIRRLVELGVEETNVAFQESGVETRLRLIAAVEAEGYGEAGATIGDHLERLTDPDDGFLDQAHVLRNQLGADLVKLVGGTTNGGCGTAWLMEGSDNAAFEAFAFSYTAARCISPNYTFGHEIGHNLGCRHAPDDPSLGQGAFPYSMGYKDPEHGFRTLMAYNCPSPCARQLRWSHPEGIFEGRPLGTPDQDNARSIGEVREVVASFRPSRRSSGGRLSWAATETFVDERAGSVELEVVRNGGTEGTVRVDWSVRSGSAEVDRDAPSASGTLEWPANDDSPRTVDIQISDDRLVEGSESFFVELSEPSPNAELGTATTAVTILDNDVEPFECWTDARRLCLGDPDPGDGSGRRPGDGRFEVVVGWRHDGTAGPARVVPGSVVEPESESGLLWFFDPRNWEMLVKVLDGCGVNGHFWVLFAAGTDVEYELRVTDAVRGEVRTYYNPPGTPARAVSDLEAFACF